MEGIKAIMPPLFQGVQAARADAMSAPKRPSVDASPATYECQLCRDEEIIFDPIRNVARQCDCVERKRLGRVMKSTNMNEDALYKTFDNFSLVDADPRVRNAYELAREYSDGLVARIKKGQGLKGVPWFGLLGTSGCGKTHLVNAATGPLIELGVHPLFFNWVQSFTEWFAYYNGDDAYMVEEIRQKIYNCDLLVVDDVCKESQKDTWIKEFYGIVDYRYRKQLPIVYTSEYFHQLIGYLSKATAGRLFERTKSPKGRKFLGDMLLYEDEDPLALDYRFKELLG